MGTTQRWTDGMTLAELKRAINDARGDLNGAKEARSDARELVMEKRETLHDLCRAYDRELKRRGLAGSRKNKRRLG